MADVKEYASMSGEELDALNNDFSAKRDAIRAEQQKIRDARALKAAMKKVETMTETEKNVLAQVLKPAGINSQERVGTPGKS